MPSSYKVKIPLGNVVTGKALRVTKDDPIEERISNLEKRLYEMEIRFANAKGRTVSKRVPEIPNNVLFIGNSKGRQYTMVHTEEGFRVGNRIYGSLSAAAEGVSGVRRSGWTFWCLPDGKTAKEAFGKR